MKDNLRMDSHKLAYHPEAVARWLKGEDIYPIEIEISPSGSCNHRCIFCAVDYVGYQPCFLDKDIILQNIKYMSSRGLKSVICSGEGEPLLNRDMPQIANGIKEFGVDVAMSTNGVLFTKEKIEECLSAFTWVRFSVASLEKESYKKIQCSQMDDLDKVINNIVECVKVKKDKKLKTTLGVQCLLLPDNKAYLNDMALQLKEIGVDYLTIKPYSQHLHSENRFEIDYKELLNVENELKQYETKQFSIYFRANAMKKMHCKKEYESCYGLPFMTHIDAKGNVWPCVAHIGNIEYCYGNIYDKPFRDIWESDRKKDIIRKFESTDLNKECREACRLDEINKYLNELRNPNEHVNFI